MTQKEILKPEMLRKLISYDASTGELTWKPRGASMFADGARFSAAQQAKQWNGRNAGRPAFTATCGGGYRRGSIFGDLQQAHRVAWAIYFGRWPSSELDHKNRDPQDNRIANLREASPSQNSANKPARGKASKYKGITPHKKGWIVQVGPAANRLRKFVKCETKAALLYDNHAALIYGEFAVLNFPKARASYDNP